MGIMGNIHFECNTQFITHLYYLQFSLLHYSSNDLLMQLVNHSFSSKLRLPCSPQVIIPSVLRLASLTCFDLPSTSSIATLSSTANPPKNRRNTGYRHVITNRVVYFLFTLHICSLNIS
ncbi:hypothetical protein P9112_005149 [Eukaryota sp. TZLM1-RC]